MEAFEDLSESETSLNLNEKIPRAGHISMTPMNSYKGPTMNLALHMDEEDENLHLDRSSPVRSIEVTHRGRKKFALGKKSLHQLENKEKQEIPKVLFLIFS
jgi:hypothetical protein